MRPATRIEDYLGTLPADVMGGDGAELPDAAIGEALRLAGVGEGDVFYHLGCGSARGVNAAVRMGAAEAVGVDSDPAKVRRAQSGLEEGARVVCADAREADISRATAVLSWFADEAVTVPLLERFGALGPGARIVTLWGPPPGCLPQRVRFPYVLCEAPLREARDMREQLAAVFGVDCVDFVTAWEFAERYSKAVAPGTGGDRFLTIIQTLAIWINARNAGLACGEGIPEPVRAYMGMMREHFGIDFGHLLE